MNAKKIRSFGVGVIIEMLALGVVYLQFRFLNRVPIYSVFYAWPIDLVLEPPLFAAGFSNRGALFAFLFAILLLVNSLKWTGLLFLQRTACVAVAIILWTLFVLSVLVSFRLEGL